ncbi:N-acetylmuramoyl-L-alanine amidase [Ekhidna sp.]|uniref:N-acetylmuramoyl-L-alanine amidase family protein n=1 Tax=Ekhidna sp. TaxID=2608089 RepID=UPI003512E756
MRNLVLPIGLTLFFVLASFHPIGKVNFAVTKIVIDAGHGGKDPGTLGSYTKEKDVALKVAMMVGEYVEKYIPDVKVIYTRKDDTFVDLDKRAALANKHEADLFVSIHANSLPKTTPISRKAAIKGSEVYVMGSQNTDRALEVAKRENSVILLEEDYEKKYEFDPQSEESYILYNLTQSAYQDNSVLIASLIDDQLTNRAGRRSYGVKQSSLYLMWSTAMPSVLVEIGYLSNPTEEKELNNPEVQSYIASGIYRAIKEYKEAFDAQN